MTNTTTRMVTLEILAMTKVTMTTTTGHRVNTTNSKYTIKQTFLSAVSEYDNLNLLFWCIHVYIGWKRRDFLMVLLTFSKMCIIYNI